MKNIKTLGLILLVALFGCMRSSDLLPDAELDYLEEYICWPYDVTVYSAENVRVDSLFYTYPLQSYFGENPKYHVSTWAKYADVDSTIWVGMNKELELCNDNNELYKQVINGADIYYAGSYQYVKNKQGNETRYYELILFLNIEDNKLHIFKNINKVY